MATPAQRPNTWTLDTWYDQAVAGTQGDYNSNGLLFSWGGNIIGGLGQNNETDYSSPTQVGSDSTWSDNRFKLAGGYRNANAIKTDGTLWAWGLGSNGQLGQNEAHNDYHSSPTQVGTDTDWSSVHRGYEYGIYTKTDGTLWMSGRGNNGQLGQGNRTNYSSPIQIPGTWKQNARIGSGKQFVLAVKEDGALWSWGYQNQGQLGLNQGIHISSPTQVGTDTTWTASMNSYSPSINGYYSMGAVKTCLLYTSPSPRD